MAKVNRATKANIRELTPRLGEGDKLEVLACGRNPDTVLFDLFDEAVEIWAGEFSGKTEVVFGVTKGSVLTNRYCAFLLGSGNAHAIGFMKKARRIVERWRREYYELECFVDPRNLRAQRWLSMLGFTPSATFYAGPWQRPMMLFTLMKKAA